MKGKNWREEAPRRQSQYHTTPTKRRPPPHKKKKKQKKQKRKKGFLFKLFSYGILFAVGYICFMQYYFHLKPYTVAIDFGHGGIDVGAVGLIEEVEVIEKTGQYLVEFLQADGRFHIVLSREIGETMSINDRNKVFRKNNPDLVLSLHANASTDEKAYGFECYPTPPGYTNHEISMDFARAITTEMNAIGARLRGDDGIRFGYYVPVENKVDVFEKLLVESSDTELYPYNTFGILTNMTCPAVLVEQCFVTNAEEVAKFCSDEGAMNCAKAYYLAIVAYLESLPSE